MSLKANKRNKNKSFYLSVKVFSTTAPIGDIEISKQIYCKLNRKLLKIPTGGRLISWLFQAPAYLQSVGELNLEPPNTVPSSGREEI